MIVLRWKRYEIENYLLHPEALLRFVEGSDPDLLSLGRKKEGFDYLEANFPPPALSQPLVDSDYLLATPASKSLLPSFLAKAQMSLSKKDYYQIAAQMKSEEIHPEVIAKLNEMSPILTEGLR